MKKGLVIGVWGFVIMVVQAGYITYQAKTKKAIREPVKNLLLKDYKPKIVRKLT